MGRRSIQDIVIKRDYDALENLAESKAKNGHWGRLVKNISQVSPKGKARDALIHLLDLKSIGGTDANIFVEFKKLNGTSLEEIQAEAVDVAINLLKDQLRRGNTYFIDGEKMLTSPFVILFEDVTNIRLEELRSINDRPTRNDLLNSYYGFTLLVMGDLSENSSQGRRYGYYWRRRYTSQPDIAKSTSAALRQLISEYKSMVTIDTRYQTLGSSFFFSEKCGQYDSKLLSEIVRMSMYQTPWDRGKAALKLGRNGDARTLPYLHRRMEAETDRKAKVSIAKGIGLVGHADSFEILRTNVYPIQRYGEKISIACTQAIGNIWTSKAEEYLRELIEKKNNKIKVEALQSLSSRNLSDFPKLLESSLKSRSKMVLRNVAKLLFEEGKRGLRILNKHAPKLVSSLYNDRPSRAIVRTLLSYDGVVQDEKIHELYAKKIEKKTKGIDQMKRYGRSGWYYNRYMQREKRNLESTITMVLKYFSDPLPDVLRESLIIAKSTIDLSMHLNDTIMINLAK